jgi:Lanthionine synthetase C-like protein
MSRSHSGRTSEEGSHHHALLERGAELLVDELQRVTPRQVRHPGLLSGRGGVAYGLWRAGVAHGDPAMLRAALRWTELALAAHRRGRIWRPRPWSLQLGYTGYHFVRARIATALGDRRLRREAVDAFAASAARVLGRGSPDLYEGAAGGLAGAAILAREAGGRDPTLASLGGALARCVLAELRRPVRRSSRYAGMAYGRGGLALAALEWSHASGRPLPAWLWSRLRGMCRTPGPYRATGSWCNGPPGLIAAWGLAFELSGEPLFLATARDLGRDAATRALPVPTLCCGPPGIAYSLLALHRVDPDAGWRTRAEVHALAALALEPDFRYRHAYGLTKGKTGVLCLALDLLSGTHAGVPGIQS